MTTTKDPGEEPLKLQGRCGAVVLHLLYQAGLVPAKQLEVSSGSGERSDDEESVPKASLVPLLARRCRVLDEHAPMLTPEGRLSGGRRAHNTGCTATSQCL